MTTPTLIKQIIPAPRRYTPVAPSPEPPRCICGQPLDNHNPPDRPWVYRENGADFR